MIFHGDYGFYLQLAGHNRYAARISRCRQACFFSKGIIRITCRGQSLAGAGIEGDVQVRRQENGISVTVQADQPDEACRIVQNALGTAENVSVRAEEKQQ